MPDIDSNATSGVEIRGYRRGVAATDGWDQYVVPVRDRIVSFSGKSSSFRIPGIAGTTGQNLFTLHNATGSTILVDVNKITADLITTAARVVEPALLRVHRITALPTGGAAMPKVSLDTTMTSSSSVTILQGASAEATAATITATIPANSILTQEWAPRTLTLVGYEAADRIELTVDSPITLRALEGICLRLDYTVATASPITDRWAVGVAWEEYTRP